MLLWRHERWVTTRRIQQRGDPANDRQRILARAVVEAAWLAQVRLVADYMLRQGQGVLMVMLTPDFRAYDAVERVIVDHECS